MTESRLWSTLYSRLCVFGKLKRIENKIDLGTPDVAYCLRRPPRLSVSGWLELKEAGWPARPTQTPLNVPHLTIDQVLWQEDWGQLPGSHVFTLVRADHNYLLLDPPLVRALFERMISADELRRRSLVQRTDGHLPAKELLLCLTS